jgi:hypothetical protein
MDEMREYRIRKVKIIIGKLGTIAATVEQEGTRGNACCFDQARNCVLRRPKHK